MRVANPLIAVTVGSSLSLTSRVRVGHLTLRHIQARRSTRHYGVGGFHFLWPLALCALRVRCDYRIAWPMAMPRPKASI